MWMKSNTSPRNWRGVEGRWEHNMAVKTTYCLRETRLKAILYILWHGFQVIKYIWLKCLKILCSALYLKYQGDKKTDVSFQIVTSTISELVLLSWGSLYSVYLSRTLSISVLAYWKSLLELLKMMSAISQSQSTLNSYAFFINPNFLFVKVT